MRLALRPLRMQLMRRRTYSDDVYTDENTRPVRTVLYDRLRLTPRDAKTAHRDHLAKQAGLLMVGVSEPLAERFKAIEEAKWKRKEKRIGEARAKGPVVGPMKRTDYQAAADIAVPLLEQLKTSPPWEVLRDDYLESMREVAEERDDPSTLDGATFRIGAVGLSTPYYAEDHGAYLYKGQLYDGVFGPGEEAGGRVQTQRKLLGILDQFKLLPEPGSQLWQTDNLDAWMKWAETGQEPPAPAQQPADAQSATAAAPPTPTAERPSTLNSAARDELKEAQLDKEEQVVDDEDEEGFAARRTLANAATGKDVDDASGAAPIPEWSNLSFDEMTSIIAGSITENWAPGARDAASSAVEWKRRAELTARLQKQVGARRVGAVEWTSRSYWEPAWTTDTARERWRERKVTLRIRVSELRLPAPVRARFLQLLGMRYRQGHAVIVADRYQTKEENRVYSLLLMRSLLTESWAAHPRFVRVNETRRELVRKQNEAARQALLDRVTNQPNMTVFTFLHH